MDAALRLLLYTHEAVLDAEPIYAMCGISSSIVRDPEPNRPAVIRSGLQTIALLRPLIEIGALHFIDFRPRGELRRLTNPDGDLDDISSDAASHLISSGIDLNGHPVGPEAASDRNFFRNTFDAISDLGGAQDSLHLTDGQLVARGRFEQLVLGRLVRSTTIDGRMVTAGTLASLEIPDIKSSPKTLAMVRADDEAFATWRSALSDALGTIRAESSEIDEAQMAKVRQIVGTELQHNLAGLNAAVAKSPALEALKSGTTGLTFGAISAMTSGLITGSPWGALAGGSAAKASETVHNYVQALSERRKAHAVLDLALLFV